MKRVVVTGMSAITPIGQDWATVAGNLKSLQTAVQYMPDWEIFEGLNTQLGAPVTDFTKPEHYSRKQVRSMGRSALMGTRVTELALENADLLKEKSIKDGSMGVSYGSSSGSPGAIVDFANMLLTSSTGSLNANSYIKMMSHTVPVNIAVFFGLKGRVITTSSACTSGSQGIGYAYEAIKQGHQIYMVAGGAEEIIVAQAAVFDTLYATSTKNDTPTSTPSPFDITRDGLVIGEGAATLILEEMEHAISRGATIHAELVGYGTNCDGTHVTQPSKEMMAIAMELALKESGVPASEIGYISAHGTATPRGDIAESLATYGVFGGSTPISALKSYIGHGLGACGSIEAWATIQMMNANWFHPTLNLKKIDPECADLDYIRDAPLDLDCEFVMSNNFAFGGINTSLIFKRWS